MPQDKNNVKETSSKEKNTNNFYAEAGEDIDYGEPTDVSEDDIEEDEENATNDIDEDDEDSEVSDEDEEESEEDLEEETDDTKDSQKEEKKKTEETTKETSKETESKPQNRDRNHEEAEKRRKAAEEEARKKADREKYLEGFKAATGGVNPFTGEKIETEDDVTECEIMLEAKSKGLDPIQDYHKLVKEHRAKERAEQEAKINEETRQKQYIQNDIAEFRKNNPNVDLTKLFNDPKFDKYKQKLNGRNSIQDMYDLFKSNQDEIEKTKEETQGMSEARKKSSVGNLNSGGDKSGEKFSIEQMKKMTPEQIKANWGKIKKSY